MSVVSFLTSGRFGNNLIQYFTAKILCKYLNTKSNIFEVACNKNIKGENCITITDETFDEFYKRVREGYIPDNNIILKGYFQFDYLMIENKEFILSIFNDSNTDFINKNYKIKDIYSFIRSFKTDIPSTDIVVHLRLNDFYDKTLHPNSIIDVIDSNFSLSNKISIVSEIKDYDGQYVNYLVHNLIKIGYDVRVYCNGNFLEDFSRLYYSKNIICSNSTYCWMAVFLGNDNDVNYVPNKWYSENQKLNIVDSKSIIYNCNIYKV